MNMLSGILYRTLLKPVLFMFSADSVHDFFMNWGERFGRSATIKAAISALWSYRNPSLTQTIHDIRFENPIGLSAGFDYDARLINILPSIGFGFHTVGTVTDKPYGGNPRPMLGRLPKSQSLLVNKGFKSNGIDSVLAHMNTAPRAIPVGMSIGATNKAYALFEEMVEEVAIAFTKADRSASFDYFELNISCPNLINIKDFEERFDAPTGLHALLSRLKILAIKRPVFIKMPLEKTLDMTNQLMTIAAEFPFIKGLIFSNLAKDRSNPKFHPDEIGSAGKGNFSGKPTEEKSNELVKFAYQTFKDRFTIIGCGGVFTAEDAYKKIRLGASLVQMITGMIYMGPQQIGVINHGLAQLLKRDGFTHISEAIGKDAQR